MTEALTAEEAPDDWETLTYGETLVVVDGHAGEPVTITLVIDGVNRMGLLSTRTTLGPVSKPHEAFDAELGAPTAQYCGRDDVTEVRLQERTFAFARRHPDQDRIEIYMAAGLPDPGTVGAICLGLEWG